MTERPDLESRPFHAWTIKIPGHRGSEIDVWLACRWPRDIEDVLGYGDTRGKALMDLGHRLGDIEAAREAIACKTSSP